MIRDAIKTILTCRRELTILRREVDRLRMERDDAQKDAAHLDQMVRDLRTFRTRTLAALALPETAGIEDIEKEINPLGWPTIWSVHPARDEAEITLDNGDWVKVERSGNFVRTHGPRRHQGVEAVHRDAHALAATLARRLRQEPV
jgi:hypothetical protein